MSYVRAAKLVAVLLPFSTAVWGQAPALSITNYQLVSKFGTAVTYRADIVNRGAALTSATATLTSLDPFSVRTRPGQDVLNFGAVPANGQVTSTNTFTVIMPNPEAPLDSSKLSWTFQTTGGGPLANAGQNQTAALGSSVMLYGGGSSDSSGGSLTYNWQFLSRPAGSLASLSDPSSVMPTFVVDVRGDYVVMLTVSNGQGSSSAQVTVSTINAAPTANAGPNQTVQLNSTVTLNGSASSDPEGDPLTYSWILTSRPANSTAALTGANTVSPTFTADKAGTYSAQLTVNDGHNNSAAATVMVTTQIVKPVANAGQAQMVNVNSTVQLNGAGSTDANGLPLTYRWTLTTAPASSAAAINNPTGVNPTFTADRPGNYVAQLIVNNGTLASDAATVMISTNPVLPPTANAGNNQNVNGGATVTLNGSGTDPQNLPLTYQWSLTNKPLGSSAVLSSAVIPNPSFVADLAGNYVAQLIVNNGVQSSPASTVTISTTCAQPVANPGPTQNVLTGSTVALDGSASGDVCHDPLTYAWSFTMKPNGSTAVFSSATAATPTFVADKSGTYVAQLIVNNGVTPSNPVTVTINAGSTPTITLTPNPLSISTGATGTMNLKLSSNAGAGGQTVMLSSGNTAAATVPASVKVPAGSNNVDFTVTPVAAGTSSITASAASFVTANATVNVAASKITVALDSPTVAVAHTINGTITLSAAAPSGGVSVTLAAAPGGIADVQPASVAIAAGSSAGAFTVSGTAVGPATITASATGYTSGTANVTVNVLGAISLPTNVKVGLGATVPFAVTLSAPAPAGGATVTLASTDASKVSIQPVSVSIAAGATTPATQPTVKGISLGSANIGATSPGYTSDSQSVQVTATATLTPNPLAITGAATKNLTFTLSAPTPVALTVNLTSDNPSAATVPATVTVAATSSSITVPVTGVAAGTATIHASALPGVADTTAAVNVASAGTISLPANVSVTPGQSAPFAVTLSTAAPAGGVTVTLASADTSKVTVSPASVSIAAGATTPATQPQVTGVAAGSAAITAAAPGWTSASQSVQVITLSISFSPATLSINGTATQNLTLNLSAPAPAGGLTFNLSSSNAGVATVPASVSAAASATSVSVPVTGVAPGSTTITASATGITPASTTVTVASDIILPANVTVPPGQTAPFQVTLSKPAPSGGVFIALTSSDASKLTIAPAFILIREGSTIPTSAPNVMGVAIGSATITATAFGLNPTSQLVQVTSGSTMSFAPPTLTITGMGTQSLQLNLSSPAPAGGLLVTLVSSNTGVATVPSTVNFPVSVASLPVSVTGVAPGSATITASASATPNATAAITVNATPGINLPATTNVGVGLQAALPVSLTAPAPAGGITITLTNSDASKATVPASVFIPQGATSPVSQPQVTGVAAGSTNLTATAPGYTSANGTVQVTAGTTMAFTPATLNISGTATQNLTLTLSAPAPAGGITVALSSSDPSKATVPASVNFAATVTSVSVPVTGVAAGPATVIATSAGIPNATAAITVTASGTTMTLSPASLSIAATATQNLTLTLSAPAPAGGITVALGSSNTAAATVPASVSIPATATSVPVPVTGVAPGSATILATSAGIPNASASITVTGAAAVTLPATTTVGAGQSATFAVTLTTPAPNGGVTVTLSSSDTSKATVPASIFIAAGATTPATQPQVSGVAAGASTLNATAPGYAPASGQIQVTAATTMSFSPASVSITGTATQNIALNLSAPAPAGGVTVNLISSNTGAATVPASVFIAGNTSSANVAVTGVAPGSATLTASASGIPNATASVTVAVASAAIILPANVSVAPGQTVPFPVMLATAAPGGGVFIALSSNDNSKLTIAPSFILIREGQTAPSSPPNITGVSAGSATITASAFNLPPASQIVQVGSGASMSFSPGSLTIPGTSTQTLALTLPAPAPAGGVTVNLSSSNPAAATVPATVNFPVNVATMNVPVTGVAPGTTTITASATGYLNATAGVAVSAAASISVPNVSVTVGQSAPLTVTLNTAAPAGGLTVALVSSDPSKATVPASVSIPAGATSPASQPLVNGVAAGSATITASGAGYASGMSQVQVNAAGGGTSAFLPNTVTVNAGSAGSLALTLTGGAAPAGGLTATLSSSNPAAASVPATVTFAGGATTVNVPVTGVAAGAATITAVTPNFGTANASVTVSASSSGINLPPNVTVALGQTATLPVTLATPAPDGGVFVSISGDPSKVAIAPSNILISQGNTVSNQSKVTGLGVGTFNLTATAVGFTSGTGTVTVTPPAMIFSGSPLSLAAGNQGSLTLNLSGGQAPPSGFTVNIASSNTAIATVPATVTFAGGAQSVLVPVTGTGAGSATITASVTGVAPTTATVNVTQPSITVGNAQAGIGQQAPLQITLSAAATSAVTLTLTSSDTSKVTVPATVMIAQGATSPAAAPQATGVGAGSATITVSGTGYNPGSGTVTVSALGLNFTGSPLALVAGNTGALTLNLTNGQAPAGGLTVNLNSSNTGAATVPATVTIPANSQTVAVPVTGVGAGAATITASASGIANATGTVNVTQPSITVAGTTVALGQQGTLQVTLSAAAPAPLTINLSNSDPTKATVPATVTIAQGATSPAAPVQITGNAIGTTMIAASAPGYSGGSGTVTVSAPSMAFSPNTLTLNPGAQGSLTLNLTGGQAPAGGLTVSLNSSNTGVATVPASVSFAPNSTSTTVQVNGAGGGSSTITASGTGLTPTTATVSVGSIVIGVPNTTSIGLGLSAAFPVTLSAPAPSNITVTLTSSDPTKVTVPASVSIVQGATTPATQPQVTGAGIGSATITASATGAFVSGSGSVTVTAPTMTFSPSVLTVNPGAQGTLTLNLTGGKAPAGGLAVSLSSSNTGVATVGATANFAAGATSVAVPVTGAGVGMSTITATAAGIANTTANVTVGSLAIGVPANISLGLGQAAPFTVTLSAAAPAPVTVALSSSNSLQVSIPSSVVIPQGATTAAVEAQVTGAGIGSATITASATGYSSGTSSVAVTAPALSFSPASAVFDFGTPGSITLNLTGGQGPPNGLLVNLTSNNTGVFTAPGNVTFGPGATTVNIPLTGVSAGSGQLSASAAGIGTISANVTVNSVVAGAAITIPSVSVGNNLEASIEAKISQPAAGGVLLTLTSSDPSKLVITGRPNSAGMQRLNVGIPAGLNSVGGIYLQGLASSGSVVVSATADGYSAGSALVTLTPSGFIITGPGGGSSFTTNVGSSASTLTLNSVRLDSNLNFAEVQAVRGGFSASVAVNNSNANAGTVATPVAFGGGVDTAMTLFTPTTNGANAGTATLTVAAAAGFDTPTAGRTVAATVQSAGISCTPVTVGKNLEASVTCSLQGGTPQAGQALTIMSADSSKLLLAAAATDAGTPSITILTKGVIGGGIVIPQFYVYGLANSGSVNYSVTGFVNGGGSVTLAPSGFVIAGPGAPGTASFVAFNNSTTINVLAAQLDSSLRYVATQALAGGQSVNLAVTSSNNNVGTISSSPVTIAGGSTSATTQFVRAGASGNSDLQLGAQPAGFSTPAANYTKVTASVLAQSLLVTCDNATIGQNLQVGCSVSLGQPAPAGGLAVTLNSGNSAQLLLSSSATAGGLNTLMLTIPQGSNSVSYFAQALGSSGAVTHTAGAAGYADVVTNSTLAPSGVVMVGPFGLNQPFIFTNVGANIPVDVYTAYLAAGSNSFGEFQALRGGISPVQVTLTSIDQTVATITPSVMITGGTNHSTAQFNAVGAGSTTVFLTTPAGFVGSSNRTSLSATVQ